jgi:hypothetical protein
MSLKILWIVLGVEQKYFKGDDSMEFVLLAKVGMIIDGIVKLGYCVAGGYFVKTGVKYVQDYKESVAKEKGAI